MQNIIQFSIDHPVAFSLLLAVLVAWSISWKGFALWRAARKSDRIWFVALLLLNTVGLLEIFYLFVWNKIRPKDQDKDPI
jgi:hypothetical protein